MLRIFRELSVRKGTTVCSIEFDAETKSRVEHCNDFNAALDVLADVVKRVGFSKLAYGYIATTPRLDDGRWLPLKLSARGFPHDWDRGWTPYMAVDPYYRQSCCGLDPIVWDDVRGSSNLTRKQAEAIAYLDARGISKGITVPMHLPFGRFACLSVVAETNCASEERFRTSTVETLAHVMHIFTHSLFKRRLDKHIPIATDLPMPIDLVPLTQRELECIAWAARGKTADEIAVILGRSRETVRLHLKRCIAKMNASNKTQAVVQARELGLI